MTPETLTAKLHAQADAELRDELNATFEANWKQVDPRAATAPDPKDWPDLKKSLLPGMTELPWFGSVAILYKEMMFAYLATARREKAVNDFMAKVNGLQEQLSALNDLP